MVVGHTTLKRYPRSIKADGQADGQQSENLMMRELAGSPGWISAWHCSLSKLWLKDDSALHGLWRQVLRYGTKLFRFWTYHFLRVSCRDMFPVGEQQIVSVYWIYCPSLTECCWNSQDENIWALMSLRYNCFGGSSVFLGVPIHFRRLADLCLMGGILWPEDMKMAHKSLTSQWVK